MTTNYMASKWSSDTDVVFLHGFGSSAENFRQHWLTEIDKSRRYFLDGHERDGLTNRLRWFPFTKNEQKLAQYISEATPLVESRIQSLDLHNFVLVGHSQGAMIGLELLRRQNLPIKELWSYSGFLPTPLHLPFLVKNALTLYLLSSEKDEFIAQSAFKTTDDYFKKIKSIKVITHKSYNLSHSFSRDWLIQSNHKQNQD